MPGTATRALHFFAIAMFCTAAHTYTLAPDGSIKQQGLAFTELLYQQYWETLAAACGRVDTNWSIVDVGTNASACANERISRNRWNVEGSTVTTRMTISPSQQPTGFESDPYISLSGSAYRWEIELKQESRDGGGNATVYLAAGPNASICPSWAPVMTPGVGCNCPGVERNSWVDQVPRCFPAASNQLAFGRYDAETLEFTLGIGDLEPWQTPNLALRVLDDAGRPASGIPVKISVTVQPKSGGHTHGGSTRPKGRIGNSAQTGKTGTSTYQTSTPANGIVPFVFTVPPFSGDYMLKAECTDASCSEKNESVWVGIKNLISLGPSTSQSYGFTGGTDEHPEGTNHYFTQKAASQVVIAAVIYKAKYGLPVIFNDSSLERGGRFDANGNWSTPHTYHCRGTEVDVRANGAPGSIPYGADGSGIAEVTSTFAVSGAGVFAEVPKDDQKRPQWNLRHYHIWTLGSKQETPACGYAQ